MGDCEYRLGGFACSLLQCNVSLCCRCFFAVIGGAGLSGTEVLENKLWLACLEKSLPGGVALKSQVLHSTDEACDWCIKHYQTAKNEKTIWMLKEAGGNCGEGLYVLTYNNKEVILRRIRAANIRRNISYVAQEYVAKPLLWRGTHKFHMRVYLIVRGNGEAYMFSKALAHIANKPFEIEKGDQEADSEVHITNVAMNHHNKMLFHGCPVVDFLNISDMNKYGPDNSSDTKDFLPEDTTTLLTDLFSQYISQAYDNFMSNQLSESDFIHIGADVIFDQKCKPYILEFNVPPCTGMYGEKMEAPMEELFYKMFCSIVENFVLCEYVHTDVNDSYASWITINEKSEKFSEATVSTLGKNMFRWALYKRRLEREQQRQY
eukprot:CAMPEP_0204821852 /NCGR_PEP_ID=MMETSP1346-20131115/53_1 /ASSEMBLY_ACC=CAM_ASM_000771 /TAXON_ID=215587 /ORGANISM="Aplanochytrium stocchinoi, Strain GSBS06" /LENGTH=375 /DNA_ID=CAMNT_0051947783 /DNA_START=252 /DNA_END=1379 /DNA_ORIENTATION=-